jgi:hypothetical protein
MLADQRDNINALEGLIVHLSEPMFVNRKSHTSALIVR